MRAEVEGIARPKLHTSDAWEMAALEAAAQPTLRWRGRRGRGESDRECRHHFELPFPLEAAPRARLHTVLVSASGRRVCECFVHGLFSEAGIASDGESGGVGFLVDLDASDSYEWLNDGSHSLGAGGTSGVLDDKRLFHSADFSLRVDELEIVFENFCPTFVRETVHVRGVPPKPQGTRDDR